MSDLLQKNQFTLTFAKLPTVTLYCQKAPIPRVSLSYTKIGTPFAWIKEPDTKPEFGDWTIQFKLDKNVNAYIELFNWWNGLAFPQSHDEYVALKGSVERDRRELFSDATLTILDNVNHINMRVNFVDVFPTDISEVDFQTTVQDAQFLDVNATFGYQRFTLENIS